MLNKIAAVVLLAVALSGCAARQKNVTDLPPGVTLKQAQDWDAAVANVHKVATFTSTARQTVIDLNHQGVFPDGPAYATSLTVIGKIDELQISAANILKQSPNNFSAPVKAQVQDLMNQISAQLTTLNTSGVTGIKNQTSLQKVNGIIGEITGAVGLILAL